MNNLLFYSNKCRVSMSILNILKNENMIQHFRMICVDDPNVVKNLPSGIDRVPTMVIPSIRRKLVGTEILVWVKTVKSQNNRLVNQNQKVPETSDTQVKAPIGFISQEMSGLSDTYAYTNIDEIPRHTYQSCSDFDKSTIFTAPETNTKINSQIQPTRIKTLEITREKQDRDLKTFFTAQRSNVQQLEVRRNATDKMINDIVDSHQKNIIQSLDK